MFITLVMNIHFSSELLKKTSALLSGHMLFIYQQLINRIHLNLLLDLINGENTFFDLFFVGFL